MCGVAIGYVGSKSFVLANQTADKNGRLLLIEAIADDLKFLLKNIYKCNTESQQLFTLTELHKILQHVDDIGNNNIIIGGEFNFHGKKIVKMIEFIESFELRDIWRIRNPSDFCFSSKSHFRIHTAKA